MTRLSLSRLVLAALVLVAAGAIALWLNIGRAEPERPCEARDFEGSRFIVCTYDAERHQVRLASRGADGAYLRSFDALQRLLDRDARRVRFAMNAGMFNNVGAPIGLYIEGSDRQHVIRQTDGPGNFHMKPNGVFWVADNGDVHVDTTDDFVTAAPTPLYATQSGPMLLINGQLHPRFSQDGASRYLRNGVGVSNNRTAYFVISSGLVSFGRFARFFRDELGVTDALFLDGSVSSLWAPSLDRQDDNQELGPLVVVLDRER